MSLLTSLLLWVVAAKEPTFALQRQYKVGDIAEYSVHYEGVLLDTPLVFDATSIEEITKLENGRVGSKSTTKGAVIAIGNDKSPAQPESVDTLTFKPDGTDITFDTDPALWKVRQAYLTSMVYPLQGVGLGGTYERTLTLGKDAEATALSVKGKVLGTEVVKGVTVLKVGLEMSEQRAKLPATFSGNAWLDPRSFVLLRLEGTVANLPFDGGIEQPSRGKLVINILKLTPGK